MNKTKQKFIIDRIPGDMTYREQQSFLPLFILIKEFQRKEYSEMTNYFTA